MSYALQAIIKTHWAITDDALKALVSVAQNHKQEKLLEKFQGDPIKSTQKAHNRGGVGVIPVRDSLFMRANLMTEHCGATSYASLMKDLNSLIEDDSIHTILLDIDSPGGEAGGCSELADAIYGARDKKPIVAYISDYGASAAYWIASACERIYASDSAIVGSIGTQIVAWSGENESEIRIVASQSPNKNRDPGTAEGTAALQERADALAEIFVQKVARNRGISREAVMENYGQGSVFVGAAAQKRGLVDEISTLENVISQYGEKNLMTENITAAFIAEKHPEIAQFFMLEGEKAAIARISAEDQRKSRIRALGKGQVSDEFLSELIHRGTSVQDAALEILIEAQKSPRTDAKKAIEESLGGLNIPPIQQLDNAQDQKKSLDRQIEETLAKSIKIDGIKVKGQP